MTNAQKLALRLSEIRQKLNALSGRGDLSEAEAEEMRSLSASYPKLEERHRAAIISESTEEAAALDGEDGDGERRERAELRSRARLARYVGAALDGLPVHGAEAEFSASVGCPGAVPLELFETRREATGDPERRAVTPAPATTDAAKTINTDATAACRLVMVGSAYRLVPGAARGVLRVWDAAGDAICPQSPNLLPLKMLTRHPTRFHTGQQPLELLQALLRVRVDDRLQLVAAVAERPHPIGRRRQFRVQVGQHLPHLPRALAGRVVNQLPPPRLIEHQRRLRLHGRPGPGRRTTRSRSGRLQRRRDGRHASPLAVERPLQVGRGAQRQRSVLQSLARPRLLGAQPHGADAPCRGRVAVAQFAHGILE